MTREEYFIDVQKKEREFIQQLFVEYFEKRGCTNLETTPITAATSFDGTFHSGATRGTRYVTLEAKRRAITTKKYEDSFIESIKFKELYKHHCAGRYCLFIVEYQDYIFIWDLWYHFLLYKTAVDHMFFITIQATGNNFDYQEGQKEKDIRGLKYGDATIILTKDFQQISYKEFLMDRIIFYTNSEK